MKRSFKFRLMPRWIRPFSEKAHCFNKHRGINVDLAQHLGLWGDVITAALFTQQHGEIASIIIPWQTWHKKIYIWKHVSAEKSLWVCTRIQLKWHNQCREAFLCTQCPTVLFQIIFITKPNGIVETEVTFRSVFSFKGLSTSIQLKRSSTFVQYSTY